MVVAAVSRYGIGHRGPAAVAGLTKRRIEKGLPVGTETQIYDCNGRLIEVGAKVDGGNGVTGTVITIHDPDENWGGVSVEWPEWPNDPEQFWASGDWRTGRSVCQDIEALPALDTAEGQGRR